MKYRDIRERIPGKNDIKPPTPSVEEMCHRLAIDNPGRYFIPNSKGTAVGVWQPEYNEYHTVIGWTILGTWVRVPGLVVDGIPVDTYPDTLHGGYRP